MTKQPDTEIYNSSHCSLRLKDLVCWTSLRHDPLTSKTRPRFRACIEHPWIIPGWNPQSRISGPQLRFPEFPCDITCACVYIYMYVYIRTNIHKYMYIASKNVKKNIAMFKIQNSSEGHGSGSPICSAKNVTKLYCCQLGLSSKQ